MIPNNVLKKNNQGSVLVISVVAMFAILVFCGAVMDYGNYYVIKTRMQTAADASVCAGGLVMVDRADTGNKGKNAAISMLNNDMYKKLCIDSYSIDYAIDTDRNPMNRPELNVTLNKSVPLCFLGLIGIRNLPATVVAKGIIGSAGGPFDYGLFSGGSQTLNLNYAVYNCSVYSGGNINFNGGSITVNGNVVSMGSISGYPANNNKITGSVTTNNTSPMQMPDYTSYVSGNATSYNANQGTYYLSGSISGNVYVTNGKVYIGNGTTTFSNSEIIMCDGDITVNSGNVTLTGSNQVMFYSRNGNITFNGGGGHWNSGTVIAYAPNGTVDNGGGDTPFRSIVANWINIYGGNINVDSGAPTIVLPPGHVQLIK